MRFDSDQQEDAVKWDADWKEVGWKYYWRTSGRQFVMETFLCGNNLDVGCGPGFLSARCNLDSMQYTGVDFSPYGIEVAKELFPGRAFHVVNAETEKLPFKDRTFDTVICSDVLEHIKDHSLIIPELFRVSKRTVVVSVPTSMGGVGHVWPIWTAEDLTSKLDPFGKQESIQTFTHYSFHVAKYRRK